MLQLTISMRHCHTLPTKLSCGTVWRYSLANFELVNDLSWMWYRLPRITDIQKSWVSFKTAFLNVMEQCRLNSICAPSEEEPAVSSEILPLIRKRNYYFKKAHRNGEVSDLLKFKHLRKSELLNNFVHWATIQQNWEILEKTKIT